jgi:hypothetical protein
MTSIAAPVRASALLRGFNRFTENDSVVACAFVRRTGLDPVALSLLHANGMFCVPRQMMNPHRKNRC